MIGQGRWVSGGEAQPLPPDSRVEKWKLWLEKRIKPEVIGMYWHRHVYRRVGEITGERQPPLPASLFFNYLRDTYGVMQSAAIRRQADLHPQAVSLARLLTEIASDPTRLSRGRFVSMFPPLDEVHGSGLFARKFAGNVGEHVDPALVEADITLLKTEAQRVTDYVDRHVAHLDRQPVAELPNFGDLHNAIDTIGDLFRKYALLLEADSYPDLVPTPQEAWETVFDVPWRPLPGEWDRDRCGGVVQRPSRTDARSLRAAADERRLRL